MRPSRSAVTLLLILAVMTMAGGLIAAAAAPPASGDRIRATLAEPGKKLPIAGTTEFVGQDQGKTFNVAIVRSRSGAVLAYVCNGTSIGRWLTGRLENGVADLSGPGGTLQVRFAKTKATGTARLGARRITFALSKGQPFFGLRRTIARAGGKTFEAAWITTNAGITRGLASEEGGKTVATSSSTNPPTGSTAGVNTAGGSTLEPTILRKFRCSRIVLGLARLKGNELNGTGNFAEDQREKENLVDRFIDLDCGEFFAL